jgi:hypothetical protein
MEKFSTFDIRDKLNIPVDRQKDWRTRGFIKPTLKSATGRGTRNVFSRFDLVLIKLFEKLVYRGYPRKQAAQIVQDVRNFKKITDEEPDRVRWDSKFTQDKKAAGKFNYILVPWGFKKKPVASIGGKMYKLSAIPVCLEDEIRIHLPTFENADEIRIINFGKIVTEVDEALK